MEATQTYVVMASVTSFIFSLTCTYYFLSFFDPPRFLSTHLEAWTITQTCKVTLTPITGGDGAQSVREDDDFTYVVLLTGQSPPPSPSNWKRLGHCSTQ